MVERIIIIIFLTRLDITTGTQYGVSQTLSFVSYIHLCEVGGIGLLGTVHLIRGMQQKMSSG